ncbi:hypothetical protein DUNSADRAFT_7245 [Dunaliella salina]|uniref:SEC7 domain-containing protein n=1 Tax=Dunaliella salina TaxID=3046 RepID=A0ABQ7GLX9_DUNSA|nr:hypothetical protein DUNSADRAFT_7245 [Dunaliella salina]|eukprot:KAF5835546.1 hypothetical protein DUNSADRAFT_7245 [Dunaliella salina]
MADPVAQHPAATVVAIALRKIVSRLDARKDQDTLDDCNLFLENINAIIPAHSEQEEEQKGEESAGASGLGASAQGEEGHQHAEAIPQEESKYQGLSPNSTAEGAPSTPARAPATREEAGSKDAASPGQNQEAEEPGEGTPHKPWSAHLPRGEQPSIPAAFSLAPRTINALSDAVCLKVMAILQRVMDTGKAAVMEVVLDCLQKLVAFSFLQGAVYAVDVGDSKDGLDAGAPHMVGVFFPMILLKPFEHPNVPGAGAGAAPGSPAPPPGALQHPTPCPPGLLLFRPPSTSTLIADTSHSHQEALLRLEALQALVHLVEALLKWYRQTSGLTDGADEKQGSASAGELAGVSPRKPSDPSAPHTPAQPHLQRNASTAQEAEGPGAAGGGGSEGNNLGAKRAYKARFQEGVALFNAKPKKGLELLQEEGMLGRGVNDVAMFLLKTKDLDKTTIGSYLGEREDFNIKVMHAFIDALDFQNMEFDMAIRTFLAGFRLPGEAQKIDRLMEKFAERYLKCNPNSFKSADVAYVLAYSVIMLNTDLHNPQVKKKMTKEGFLKNNRGINDGHDLPADYMSALYDRIAMHEIKMKDESSLLTVDPQSGTQKNILTTLFSLMGALKPEAHTEPSDEIIKDTLEDLQDKAKSAQAVTVKEPAAVRPMMEVRIHVIALVYTEHTRWIDVLRCLSRWDLLLHVTGHAPPDAGQFSAHERSKQRAREDARSNDVDMDDPHDSVSSSTMAKGGADLRHMEALVAVESSARKLQLGVAAGSLAPFSKRTGEDSSMAMVPQDALAACDAATLNGVFLRSNRLDSEAIVVFVRSLCAISSDELRDAKAPRVFTLTKVVEVALYNMTRISPRPSALNFFWEGMYSLPCLPEHAGPWAGGASADWLAL